MQVLPEGPSAGGICQALLFYETNIGTLSYCEKSRAQAGALPLHPRVNRCLTQHTHACRDPHRPLHTQACKLWAAASHPCLFSFSFSHTGCRSAHLPVLPRSAQLSRLLGGIDISCLKATDAGSEPLMEGSCFSENQNSKINPNCCGKKCEGSVLFVCRCGDTRSSDSSKKRLWLPLCYRPLNSEAGAAGIFLWYW